MAAEAVPDEVERLLAAAERWERMPRDDVADSDVPPRSPVFAAGWEDADPFCGAICSTDIGVAFCQTCPVAVVTRALDRGCGASGKCPAGVRLLAFPSPRGERSAVAVLRVVPPSGRAASDVANQVRMPPAVLRRAAERAPRPRPASVLRAARLLRDPVATVEWLGANRAAAARERRTAAATLAQILTTSEEFHELHRASRRQRVEIERSHRRVERLVRETIRATDEERARVAHEIHDTVAQSLVSAFRFLEAAAAVPGGLPDEQRRHIDAAVDGVQGAIRDLRAVLNDLLPPGLEELGLRSALESRITALTQASGIRTTVTGDLPRLAPATERALYGLTYEAASNAVRHARASHLTVSLRVDRGRGVIEVIDDGVGFDPRALSRRVDGGGLGLLGMNRRARWIGGRLSIRTRRGAGTRIRISIPLDATPPRPVGIAPAATDVRGDGAALEETA